MKIRILFKDPDGVYEAIEEAVKKSVQQMPDLDKDEREVLVETRREHQGNLLSKFIEYGEYLHVEFDTVAGTATVLPVKG